MPSEAATPLLTEPAHVFAYLATVLAAIFWAAGTPRLKRLFDITPPVIYAYFVPTLSTAFGIIPLESPIYGAMTRYLLPVSLLLLMITIDVRAILRLGPVALLMLLAGTAGIVIGGPIAYLVFGGFLPPDAWKGFAALSGSWIGGSANMIAIAESVGATESTLAPVIVVDTVVGYGWMGVLLFLSAYQARYDAKTRARTESVVAAGRRLEEIAARRQPVDLGRTNVILGLGIAGAIAAVTAGAAMPSLGDPTIISATTWAVLIVVTIGLALSFTPVRQLEEHGASRFGYAALYLLLTAIGAQADLVAVLQAPLYFAAGALWIAIHVALLFLVARLLRAPLFFVATGSMANVGGAVSAPIVAGVYHSAMAPVGLLMAVAGYILGIYAALFCAYLLGIVAGA